MKLGILYTAGGSIALLAAFAAVLGLFIFPEAEPSIAVVLIRSAMGVIIGLWALPQGLLKIRTAREAKNAK